MDPGGQLDMQQLLAAAQEMQSALMNAQQELADAAVEGTAGGGLVRAVVNGQGELLDLTIAAAAIDPGDPAETAQTLADLVLAAFRDAYRAAGELQQQAMGPLAGLGGGAGLPGLPGLGVPGAVPGEVSDELDDELDDDELDDAELDDELGDDELDDELDNLDEPDEPGEHTAGP